jgi:hypothetical protein
MDFGGPLFTKITESNKKKLRAIQYHSMRIILNCQYGTSSTEMRNKLGIQTLDDHFLTLKKRFVSKSLIKNPMIIELKEELENYKMNRVNQENLDEILLF